MALCRIFAYKLPFVSHAILGRERTEMSGEVPFKGTK